ncbi:choice-of-anchor V domain-containing protein [Neolewinella persica]|uniref:choice-of-anchor V domain-containing protein n=1 Tax=Neolewinella persica TaxID=70998 RepID=UPI00035D2917|nr:choice-of-anchor V domain-containing protein [Neolewinella persica]
MTIFNHRYLAIFAALGLAIFFLASSGGPAAAGNYFTGAPTLGGGTEGTCNTCHSSGASTYGEPIINVSLVADGETNPITEYTPGQTYMVTVAVGYPSAKPEAIGFSSQFLTASSPAATAGVLGNPSEGAQITSAPGDRRYAEQSTPNTTDSLFIFEWTAPEAGTGEVKMYLSANLVDRNRSTGGDSGSTSPTIISFTEGVPSAVNNFAAIPHRLFPNPAYGSATLQVSPPTSGSYELSVTGMNGQTLRTERLQLTAGATQLAVPLEGLKTGVYVVSLTGTESRLVTRLLVN